MVGDFGADSDSLDLVGKIDGFQNPCMHHDQICPHFASLSAGLVKNKFHELSPNPSPHLTLRPDTGGVDLPKLDLEKTTKGLKKSSSYVDSKSRVSPASMGM